MIYDPTTSENEGFLDPSFDSDATTAGAVCRQAQSHNATLLTSLSEGSEGLEAVAVSQGTAFLTTIQTRLSDSGWSCW
jgi:hypothetical protein